MIIHMTTDLCPCGANSTFEDCCQPIIEQREVASTPEALMRSRYSAALARIGASRG